MRAARGQARVWIVRSARASNDRQDRHRRRAGRDDLRRRAWRAVGQLAAPAGGNRYDRPALAEPSSDRPEFRGTSPRGSSGGPVSPPSGAIAPGPAASKRHDANPQIPIAHARSSPRRPQATRTLLGRWSPPSRRTAAFLHARPRVRRTGSAAGAGNRPPTTPRPGSARRPQARPKRPRPPPTPRGMADLNAQAGTWRRGSTTGSASQLQARPRPRPAPPARRDRALIRSKVKPPPRSPASTGTAGFPRDRDHRVHDCAGSAGPCRPRHRSVLGR